MGGNTAPWQAYNYNAEASAREAKKAKRALARKAREEAAAAAATGNGNAASTARAPKAAGDAADDSLFAKNPNANATFGNKKIKRKASESKRDADKGFGAIMKAKNAEKKEKPKVQEKTNSVDENGDVIPGKVRARRRRAAEKRARAAEARREARAAKGLPLDKPKPVLPAKQVDDAVEANRLKQIVLAKKRKLDGDGVAAAVTGALSRHQKKRQAQRQGKEER